MKLGFIGLGKMGSRMVTKLLTEGHEVMVWNRSKDKIENLQSQISNLKIKENLKVAESVKDLVSQLNSPRIIWSMLPAHSGPSADGPSGRSGRSDSDEFSDSMSSEESSGSKRSKTSDPTEQMLLGPQGIADFVAKDDIVIDGGNAHYTDTQKRYEHFKSKGIRFLGIGVSGGVIAAQDGYPMMVGGDESAYEQIKPILDSLAKPAGGHQYFGTGGAGHFVKMVHNAIEYGYMQAIGEGFGLMNKAPYDLDLVKVARLYAKGTLVSGFMMERTVEALEDDPRLKNLSGYIEDSGEARWAIEQAKEEEVPIPIIEKSLEFRVKSREDTGTALTFAARMVAALRFAFGRHEVQKKD